MPIMELRMIKKKKSQKKIHASKKLKGPKLKITETANRKGGARLTVTLEPVWDEKTASNSETHLYRNDTSNVHCM